MGGAERPRRTPRRTFLLAGLSAALPAATAPRIAIVGGGIAGLYTSWLLKRAGIASTIYESSNRTGGRMFSAKGVAAPEVVTELGGEFVDTNHAEILGLAKHFGLDLIDTGADSETGLQSEAFLFGGAPRGAGEIAAEFRQVAQRMRDDIRRSGGRGMRRFDRMSIAGYLDSIGMRGWLRSLLDVAYRTEYGMDVEEQSAMNLLTLIAPELAGDRIRLFGDSDERYKILGGNQGVPDALAAELTDAIERGHQLESIAERGRGYRLSLRKPGGGAMEVDADVVVMTVPFSILRDLDLRVRLPKKKLRAIRELGYGTNAKIFFGFERRLWRERGHTGALFTDTDCQLVWDSSRLQPTEMGALTMLMGGRAGIAVGEGSPESHERRLLPEVEKVWSGVTALRRGAPKRFHWPSHPHTRAAYASYKVGQWRDIRGQEFPAVGNLHFAGEHCSLADQGYMEGGAETAKRVAAAIARKLGRRA
ncbi:MAG: NAD(P)/FAD-dependent oxidoreductase [Bryobacteraceae bacterium]